MPAKMDGRQTVKRLRTEPQRSKKRRWRAAPRKTRSEIGMTEDQSGQYSISCGVLSRQGLTNRNWTAARTKAKRKQRPIGNGQVRMRIGNDKFRLTKPDRRQADPIKGWKN